MKTVQQDEPKPQLNDDDRGERCNALPRPHDLRLLRVDGHRAPVLASAGVVAAPMGSHAAIDRSARNRAAKAASHRAEQAVADDARPGDGTGNTSDDGPVVAGERRQ